MEHSIGDARPILGLGSVAANTLKLAGLAAIAYAGASALGCVAEVSNHTTIAKIVFDAIGPIVDKTAQLTFGDAARSMDGSVKGAVSSMMAAPIAGSLFLFGSKLSEMVTRVRDAQPQDNLNVDDADDAYTEHYNFSSAPSY